MNPENNTSPAENSEGRSGPLAGTIVVIIVLALGAFYFWGASVDRAGRTGTDIGTDTSTEALNTQSDSTELSAIEADLSATELSGLDQELADIDLELNAN
jgi:hypothetical protein